MMLWVTGCNDAIYTLGRLPADSQRRNSCREADGALGSSAECVTKSNDTGGRSGSDDSGTIGTGGSGGAARGNGGVIGRGGAAQNRDSGAPAKDASNGCPNDARPAIRRGLNLYLLVDDSLSVVLQPAWNSLTLAISAFVDDPKNTGLGVGIGYYGTFCNSTDYSNPAVRVAPLPGVAQAIKTSYPLPINGKAITPALNGALAYMYGLAQSQADRDVALALVTDTIADPLCGSTQTTAAQAIASRLAGTPSVPTYVIGLGAGPTLLDPVNIIDTTPLDALAVAGGTKQVHRIEVNLTTNAVLTAALNEVTITASPCAFEVPADIDPNHAAIEWEPVGLSTVTRWPHVASAGDCGGGRGVFVRPGSPGFIELCPASCSELRSGPDGRASIRTECP
jgi:hypothetical protein